jgi:hypothetical protein
LGLAIATQDGFIHGQKMACTATPVIQTQSAADRHAVCTSSHPPPAADI